MKWVTREDVKVGRMACSWLIERFVDSEAEILYVPRNEVREIVEQDGAIPFHVPGSELAHNANGTSFEAILTKYDLRKDPALDLMGKIINGADTDNRRYNRPEGPGVRAIADGFRSLGFPNDRERVARASIVFDALYAYCKDAVKEASGS